MFSNLGRQAASLPSSNLYYVSGLFHAGDTRVYVFDPLVSYLSSHDPVLSASYSITCILYLTFLNKILVKLNFRIQLPVWKSLFPFSDSFFKMIYGSILKASH